jgi:hypothetical protein
MAIPYSHPDWELLHGSKPPRIILKDDEEEKKRSVMRKIFLAKITCDRKKEIPFPIEKLKKIPAASLPLSFDE